MNNSLLNALKHSWLMLLLTPAPVFAKSYLYDLYAGGSLAMSAEKLTDRNPLIKYNGLIDTYPTPADATSPAASVNAGIEFNGIADWMTIDLGAGFYSALAYENKGTLMEKPVGGVNAPLYNYKYNISNMRAMLETQINFIINNFSPFINAGVGPSWNSAKSYKESPNSTNGYPPLAPFNDRTTTTYAYQGSVGISYLFGLTQGARFQNQRLSIGYRYAYLGRTEFGSRGADYPYTLNFGTMHIQDVYLAYTHYF